MQFLYKLTFLLLLVLLIIAGESLSNSLYTLKKINVFKQDSPIQVIDSKISIQTMYSGINKHTKGIYDLCPKGSSPIFNEISYTCKIDNNNRYVSTKLNSFAPLTNTLLIHANGNIFSKSESISATDIITGQTSKSNIGESTLRSNILGKQIYIDGKGQKFQYVSDLYENRDKNKNLIAFNYQGDILNDIKGDRYNILFDIERTDLETILTYAIYNKESNINYVTLPADNINSDKEEYITSSGVLNYSDTNWDILTYKIGAYLNEVNDKEEKPLVNNIIRPRSNVFTDTSLYDQIILKRTVAQAQDWE